MITEDYVSYEVAKLLKEKGFYTPYCYHYYFPELKSKTPCITNRVIPIDTDKYLAPTHQMALKWLREVHNIEINISMSALNSDNSREYMFNIFFTNERYLEPSKTKTGFKCYEEAVEAAIKYCLTNLIK